MNRYFSFFLCLFLFVPLFSGCKTTGQMEKSYYYKPLNKMQEDFYVIQNLFEEEAYDKVIDLAQVFIETHPRDVLTVAVRYYWASSLQEKGEYAKAKDIFSGILKDNPDNDWGKLARVGLKEIEEAENE